MASKPKVSRFFAENQLVFSSVYDRYYFARKVELLGGGLRRVIGQKHDVTDSVRAIVANVIARAKVAKKRKRAGGSK